MKTKKNRSASLDGVWTDGHEATLSKCISKLREWDKAMIATPERFSPKIKNEIAQVASACARLKDEKRYAELVAIQEYLEPLIEEYISKKLSEGNLTCRDFNRFSAILRDIEKQKLLRLQWSCAAG